MAKANQPSIHYQPKNPRQEIVREIWGDESLMMLTIGGPAGTGKTTAALAEAFLDVLTPRSKRTMVYLARPTVSVAERLGFFPGSLEEKLGPWMPAFHDVFGSLSEQKLDKLDKYWESVPVGMLRGRTFKNSVLIVDEAQNCEYEHLQCIATRVGENGRVVLCGDAEQSDLHHHRDDVPLSVFCGHIQATPGYKHVEFLDDDQRRHPFVTAVIAELRKHKRAL